MTLRVVFAAALAVATLSCGKDHGDGDGVDAGVNLDGLVSLVVTPADKTLVIDNGVPASLGYTATGTFMDGHTADITVAVDWGLSDATLGVMHANSFTTGTSHGGRSDVVARVAGVEGATPVTVMLRQTYNDPSVTDLPADPAAPFGGPADPNRAPALVYPNDGVIVPPNLGKLEFHFRPGSASNTLFEISFGSAFLDLTIFTRCVTPIANGCVFLPPPQVWSWIAESHRGSDPVTWTVRATDDAGTGVGSTGQMKVSFLSQDLAGGIYYWTTSTGSIMRFDFGSATQTMAEPFVTTADTNGTCVGCHALSRDGKKLVAEAGGQNDGRILLMDVETKTPIVPFATSQKSNFESWNPDGSQYAGVWADNGTQFNLMILNGNTGAIDEIVETGGTAAHPTNHPDWSPLGDRIAFANVGIKNTLQMMFNCEIRSVAKVNGAWQPYQVLVPRAPGRNRYYPAYAPNGKMLVFDESFCDSGDQGGECDADTNPTAKLHWVDGITGGATTELAHANAPGVADNGNTKLTNSFPKWNPFIFPRDKAGSGHIAWVTFASTRRYGLRSPPNPGTLIWMAAVDLDAPAGSDASFPAFALPFQDITTSNHIAQWTTQVVGLE